MAAADYATIKVDVVTTENNVEKQTPTDLRFPKSSLITALTQKMDLDAGITDTDYETTTDDS